MRYVSEKIRETNGGQIKEQDVPLTWDSRMYDSLQMWLFSLP